MTRPSGVSVGLDYDIIFERLRNGETKADLAREYGVTHSAIYEGAKRRGFKASDVADRRKRTPRRDALIALARKYAEMHR